MPELSWIPLDGPTWVRFDDLTRAAVICDDGFPADGADLRAVMAEAWTLIEASLVRRGIRIPAEGWFLGVSHPDMDWRHGFAPEVVAQVEADLPNHPPTAAVVAVRLVRAPS